MLCNICVSYKKSYVSREFHGLTYEALCIICTSNLQIGWVPDTVKPVLARRGQLLSSGRNIFRLFPENVFTATKMCCVVGQFG